MTSGMALVVSVSGDSATVELGSGERKTASVPQGVSVSEGDRALVMQVSGKYLIIQIY